MKEKNLAGALAFFGGFLGIHRFYLGQIPLGVIYLVFQPLGLLLGFIDALVFWSMDQEKFDYKYNPRAYHEIYGRYNPQQRFQDEDYRRRQVKDQMRRQVDDRIRRSNYRAPQDNRQQGQSRNTNYSKRHHPYKREQQNQLNRQRALPHIEKGKELFRDYDYEGAILAFERALKYDAYNYPVYFNLACAYSLEENEEKALENLDKSVELGFRDFTKIEEHDAFSFLRIKASFEAFRDNNYRLPKTKLREEEQDTMTQKESTDLLTQLNYLKDLRDRGLLSQSEFEKERAKLEA
jgi:TM2 domain-containing membrane protein YozV